MAKKITVFASSFNDTLPTHPPEELEGRRLLDQLESESGGGFEVEYRCDRDPHATLAESELAGVVAIIADLETYAAPLLSKVGKSAGGTLELIARYGVGYDAIDVEAATQAGIMVTNTPGANSRPTAEWAVATILDIAGRRLPHHGRAAAGLGKSGPSRLDVSGRVLGVVGTGAIGRTVVDLLRGFHPAVIAYDPYPNNEWAAANGVSYVSLQELFSRADFITLHAATGNQIIGADELALMRPTTALINCARECLVDSRAAYHAVASGKLWGYGLDDAWQESDLPLEGLNIAVSSHVGSDTDSGKALMQLLSARSVGDYLNDRTPASVINPAVVR